MIACRSAHGHTRELYQDVRKAKLSYLSRIRNSIAKYQGLKGRRVHEAPHVDSLNFHSLVNPSQLWHSWRESRGEVGHSRSPSPAGQAILDKALARLVKRSG